MIRCEKNFAAAGARVQARVAERGEKIIIKKILSVDYFREWENLRFLSICGEWSICGFLFR